jgi:serine/threonine protein kinase
VFAIPCRRDIKPDNVLLVPLPELFAALPTQLGVSQLLVTASLAQLTDPGVAYLPEPVSTKPPVTSCGTDGFMAPEVARGDGQPYGSVCDAYSVGVSMAALL